jgi:hypothetical protein
MNRILLTSLSLVCVATLLVACPKKGPKDSGDAQADAAAEAAPKPTPTPEPTPQPTPPPEAPERATMDMESRSATIEFRDGSTRSGMLTRVARSDRFGEKDFEDRTEVDIESGSQLLVIQLDQVKTMTSRSSKVEDTAINCDYDAAASPILIGCNVRTPMEIKLKEKHEHPDPYMVDDTYVWRFYFDGDAETVVEQPLGAIYVKRATKKEVLEDLIGTEEDTELQIEMQAEIKDRWSKGIKKITLD